MVPKFSRLRYWAQWQNIRYEIHKQTERVCLAVAMRMPGQLRLWVVVDATNEARRMFPDPTGYAGPDGLEYRHIHAGALRSYPGVER